MKRNVIRSKSIEAGSESETEPRDGGVQSVDRALSIIETLAEHAPRTQDPAVLQAQARIALSRQIVQDIAGTGSADRRHGERGGEDMASFQLHR